VPFPIAARNEARRFAASCSSAGARNKFAMWAIFSRYSTRERTRTSASAVSACESRVVLRSTCGASTSVLAIATASVMPAAVAGKRIPASDSLAAERRRLAIVSTAPFRLWTSTSSSAGGMGVGSHPT
jgi:hypothetical protein